MLESEIMQEDVIYNLFYVFFILCLNFSFDYLKRCLQVKVIKKNSCYLQIFIHGFESVDKFSITYEQHYLRILPTYYEFIGKFSITYQLLPTDIITYQLLPTNLYYLPTITHESYQLLTFTYGSLLSTNYYPQISITYKLLPTNLYYLPPIIIIIIYIILKILI